MPRKKTTTTTSWRNGPRKLRTDTSSSKFPNHIAEIRVQKHMTRKQLVDAAGISFGRLVTLERGKQSPSDDELGHLARGLGAAPRSLYETVPPVTKRDIDLPTSKRVRVIPFDAKPEFHLTDLLIAVSKVEPRHRAVIATVIDALCKALP